MGKIIKNFKDFFFKWYFYCMIGDLLWFKDFMINWSFVGVSFNRNSIKKRKIVCC